MGIFGQSLDELARKESQLKKNKNVKIDSSVVDDITGNKLSRNSKITIITFIMCFFIVMFSAYYFTRMYYSKNQGITLDEFNRIETGMSYENVVQIIGQEGELLSSVDLNIGSDYATQMYVWYGSGSVANANVTFQGNKVISKAQIGLK